MHLSAKITVWDPDLLKPEQLLYKMLLCPTDGYE